MNCDCNSRLEIMKIGASIVGLIKAIISFSD